MQFLRGELRLLSQQRGRVPPSVRARPGAPRAGPGADPEARPSRRPRRLAARLRAVLSRGRGVRDGSPAINERRIYR
jgi:hypothetical protein